MVSFVVISHSVLLTVSKVVFVIVAVVSDGDSGIRLLSLRHVRRFFSCCTGSGDAIDVIAGDGCFFLGDFLTRGDVKLNRLFLGLSWNKIAIGELRSSFWCDNSCSLLSSSLLRCILLNVGDRKAKFVLLGPAFVGVASITISIGLLVASFPISINFKRFLMIGRIH